MFAPFSLIWVHAFPEALIGEALQQSDHEITYVTCGELLHSFCEPMVMRGLTPFSSEEKRKTTCRKCRKNEILIRKTFNFKGPRLSDLVTKDDHITADHLIKGKDFSQLKELMIHGIPVGRLSLYQLLLRIKRVDLFLSENDEAQYRIELRNVILVCLAFNRHLETNEYDRVIVYNALYSVNRTVSLLANNLDVPTYFLHAGGNLSKRLQQLILARGDTFTFFPHLIEYWNCFKQLPVKNELLSEITNHHLELINGRSIFGYSGAIGDDTRNLRAHFGIDLSQRLLVAVLSSYDELYSAQVIGAKRTNSGQVFSNQLEWIKSLLRYISDRDHLFLVIRVHPREFPNQRDDVLSQHALLLKDALTDLPANVAVNWPGDNISIYDFVGETDVFLNAWSSAGKEMSLLGIPVVLYSDELVSYPADLCYLGTTEETYYAAIERALVEGWSFERARASYRWSAVEFCYALIDIGDSYKQLENPPPSIFSNIGRSIEKLKRHLDPVHQQRSDCRSRAIRLKAGDKVIRILEECAKSALDMTADGDMTEFSLAAETEAIRSEHFRLANALFPTEQSRGKSRLYALLTGQI